MFKFSSTTERETGLLPSKKNGAIPYATLDANDRGRSVVKLGGIGSIVSGAGGLQLRAL